MQKSEQINELAAALAKAQAEMKNPAFDSANPFFKSKYASLAAVRNAVIPVLAKYGLSVVQEVTHGTDAVGGKPSSGCSTILLHSSGQWLESPQFVVPVTKDDAQGACAAATYARRASLQALCCVVGDEDSDGEEIVDHKPTHAAKPAAAKPADDGKLPLERALAALDACKAVEELGTAFRFWATKDRPKPFVDTLTAKAAERKTAILAGFDAPLPSEVK